MSRPSQDAQIYTDDAEKLEAQFNSGQEKTSTLDQHQVLAASPADRIKILEKPLEMERAS